jgi:hypothetical protein
MKANTTVYGEAGTLFNAGIILKRGGNKSARPVADLANASTVTPCTSDAGFTSRDDLFLVYKALLCFLIRRRNCDRVTGLPV